MTKSIKRLALFAATAVAAVGIATPASAGTGCNGVVNIFVWGCAPWDNNNGANFPYYRKKQVAVPAGTPVKQERGTYLALVNGQWAPLVAAGGGNLVAAGGGNLVAAGGGNAVWVQQ